MKLITLTRNQKMMHLYDALYDQMPRKALRLIAKSHNIRRGRNKSDTLDNIFNSGKVELDVGLFINQ